MAKSIWSDSQIIAQLDSGYHWSGNNLTYGFPTNANWFPYAESSGFSALNSAQQATATLAIHLWDDLIAPSFSLAANGATADIKFENTTTNIGYAHAYYPGGYAGAGSVWFNPTYDASWGTNNLVTPVAGQWGYMAYLHETGHALGLDHPGTYNGGSPTYANDALYMQDSQQYTVMSYFTASNTGADWIASDGRMYYAQTPMLHDILTLQAIYGADTTTRTGNTTYGFHSNADVWLYDFTQNAHPILCIYDAGGMDTLDFSGWNFSSVINLTPGSFSNSDMMTSNISIAYGAWIENAVGGGGNDTLIGNDLANVLTGNAGSDTLAGGLGNDTLDGGAGNDTMSGGIGNDTFYVDGLGDVVLENTGEGTDTVIVRVSDYWLTANVENGTVGTTTGIQLVGNELNNIITGNSGDDFLRGTQGDDTVYGLGGNDTLYGGIGNDILDGGAGNDVLDGKVGDDIMVGGTGNDIFYVDSLGDIVVENAGEGTDTVVMTVNNYHFTANMENGIVGTSTGLQLLGNELNNVLTGNVGDDILRAAQGDDTVFGLDGNDSLYGGVGNDTLDGGAGNDFLDGRVDHDILTGGSGDDVFVFVAGEADGDVITDFNGNGAGAGDQLQLTGYGTAAQGASFTQIDSTHWQINSSNGLVHDVITLSNGAFVHPSDIVFV
jgi:Ca2+-binding RTX toxin-like protein